MHLSHLDLTQQNPSVLEHPQAEIASELSADESFEESSEDSPLFLKRQESKQESSDFSLLSENANPLIQ